MPNPALPQTACARNAAVETTAEMCFRLDQRLLETTWTRTTTEDRDLQNAIIRMIGVDLQAAAATEIVDVAGTRVTTGVGVVGRAGVHDSFWHIFSQAENEWRIASEAGAARNRATGSAAASAQRTIPPIRSNRRRAFFSELQIRNLNYHMTLLRTAQGVCAQATERTRAFTFAALRESVQR